MADYAEEWQSADTRRAGPPRLVLEAALEIFILGVIGVTIAALGLLPLTWWGTIIAVLCYALVTFLVVAGLGLHAPHRHFGIANSITLSRAAFGVLLLAVAAEEALGSGQVLDTQFRWGLTIAAATALLLDGVDGWVARRNNMTSGFGVRFDMEADGLFLLALALILFVGGIVGPWVLASGLTYYLFRLAGHVWPVLTAPLFPSWRRKAIFGTQAALLIAAIAPAQPIWMPHLCCLTGVVLLLYSFGVDVAWLLGWWRHSAPAPGVNLHRRIPADD